MRRKAFHPGFVQTGLVGLLISVLSLCTNQPALAQTANPQFKIQESDFSNTILPVDDLPAWPEMLSGAA